MNQEDARKTILKALFGDTWLYDHLVLKGGNALSLIYNVGGRTSLDLDFSMSGDLDDLQATAERMFNVLAVAFDALDIEVFDFNLVQKPSVPATSWWGGYAAEFKLIPKRLAAALSHNLERMRRQAMSIDPGSQRRKYSIEISKFEYVGDSQERQLDGVDVRVYSPVLLAIEKLRALVQQHADYAQIPRGSKRSRARDLYDIWAISDFFSIRMEMYLSTAKAVFESKRVDPRLLARFDDLRALHMASWSDVELSVSQPLEDFDFYFDFVASAAAKLHAKWEEASP